VALNVRMGVSAGDLCVFQRDDCFGAPVIEAARVCAAAAARFSPLTSSA
jgi:class 3 adenylate cyclase